MTTPDERLWFEMWGSAEEDCQRYRLAWLSARRRAHNARLSLALSLQRNVALRQESDDMNHRLIRELDRNKELTVRVYELETEIARLKRGVGL